MDKEKIEFNDISIVDYLFCKENEISWKFHNVVLEILKNGNKRHNNKDVLDLFIEAIRDIIDDLDRSLRRMEAGNE